MFKLIPRSSVRVYSFSSLFTALQTRRTKLNMRFLSPPLGKQGRFEAVADFFQFNEFQLAYQMGR